MNHKINLIGLIIAGLLIGFCNSVISVGKIQSSSEFVGLSIGYGLTTLLVPVIFGILIAGIGYVIFSAQKKPKRFSDLVYKCVWIILFVMAIKML